MDSLEIINGIRRSVYAEDDVVPLHQPYFAGNEWQYVKDWMEMRFSHKELS